MSPITSKTRTMVAARLASESGTTLIETAIAVGILLVVVTGLMSMATVATSLTENGGHLAARTAEYAQDKLEQLLALAYSDAVSDTTQLPTANSGGTGLAIGGSSNTDTPVARYVDYLLQDGSPMCPCTGVVPPTGWFYQRVWQISSPSVNLKQITVTATVASSVGRALRPKSSVSVLKTFPF
jgi:Flp pilus assembly protein TadG